LESTEQASTEENHETTEAPRESRPKRRRSRRGRGRRDRDSGPKADSDENRRPAAPPSVSAESHDADETDAIHEDVFELDETELLEGDQPARLGFRGIPRWDEVVGMMIDKNLEARSKRPASNPHRGNRGPRGPRGDNRGKGGGKRPS
jgi:hypothetical protein